MKFHHEANILKILFHKNSYPCDFVHECIIFLDRKTPKSLTPKIVVSAVLKKKLIILPYLGKLLFKICTRINHVYNEK